MDIFEMTEQEIAYHIQSKLPDIPVAACQVAARFALNLRYAAEREELSYSITLVDMVEFMTQMLNNRTAARMGAELTPNDIILKTTNESLKPLYLESEYDILLGIVGRVMMKKEKI